MFKSTLILITVVVFAACGQGKITVSKDVMNKFEEFKKREKFVEDNSIMYPGIADTNMRPELTEKINNAADDFAELASRENATEEEYQESIKSGLQRFSDNYLHLDTEDRERICAYFEELMDIVGLESSGGYLNKFMYGSDPTDW